MSKQITFDQLEHFLVDIGFVAVPTAGNYKLFEHPVSGSRVVLPARGRDELVETGRLAAIRNVIVGKGVLDGNSPEDLFDTLLEAV